MKVATSGSKGMGRTMAMFQLIYSSRAATPVDHVALTTLVVKASKANAERKVTGSLLYACGFFIQVLEGEEAVIKALFMKICLDPRHLDIRQLDLSPILERTFGQWGMSGAHGDDNAEVDPVRLGSLLASISHGGKLDDVAAEARKLLVDLIVEAPAERSNVIAA